MHKTLVFVIALVAAHLLYAGNTQPAADDEKGFTIEGHSFVALQVDDDAAAAEWYGKTFDLEQVKHLEAPNGTASVRILSGGGLSVELIDHAKAAAGPAGYQHGLFKAGFYVDDIDAALGWLVKRGVDAGIGVFTDQALHARSFVFRDPWGNRLQIFQHCKDDCE